MFVEAFEDLLTGHCTPAIVRKIEGGGAYKPLWEAISESGFLELMAAEEDGGAGLDLAGTLPLLFALGANAVPLPVGEAIVLRALLPRGEPAPSGLSTLAPAIVREEDGSLLALRVPYGAVADHVAAEVEGTLCLLDANTAQRQPLGIHRDTTADLRWAAADLNVALRSFPDVAPAGRIQAWGAALHAALIAGALNRTFELTLQYGNDRVQFGKPIGRLQAIQHQLAVMAEHVSASRMAAANAFPAGSSTPSLLPAAIAKARNSEAVTIVASIAHAVHGAIGVTEEYDLQLLTRRLHAWRLSHGSESYWHRIIGQALLDAGPARTGDFVLALQEGHAA